MTTENTTQLPLADLEAEPAAYGTVILNKDRFSQLLREARESNDLGGLKNKILSLKNIIRFPKEDRDGVTNIVANGDTLSLRRDVLVSELEQILEARTVERATYYLRRLEDGVHTIKTNKINDINLARWKEYDEIITDSLWVLERRDNSGVHVGAYWGNFIPQIPRQMMMRYTKQNDWVLDTFVGSGTTLIECRRLGRNGVGVELNAEVAREAKTLVEREPSRGDVTSDIIVGDARNVDLGGVLRQYGVDKVQMLIMHPPYYDIIKFSKNDADLSNARDTDGFLKMFGETVDNATPYLETGRYFALVIGDKYAKGEWIPLGFYCMQEVLKRDYILKSIIVKNFDETRAKRNQKELWQYRALVGGFYVFKHEYIFLFRKGRNTK